MGKKIVYTKITPLPSHVPRQLAIELLHSHEEVIKLNPLVTGVRSIDTPRDSPNDEYFSQWYLIDEIITWGFGMKKKISFKGVFHDQPWGMQSHVYAPMGVDLRNKYRIGGNQPGEPRETRELGIDTPAEGLYLREDVEIVCNLALASFVKKETKEATGKMIDRLAKKAELLDEGKLHAMFENGRLKTSKPSGFADQSDAHSTGPSSPGFAPGSPSPSLSAAGFTPRLDQKGYGNYHDITRNNSQHRTSQYMPAYQQPGYSGPHYARPGAANMPMINELPGDYYQQQGMQPPPLKPQGQVFRSELPGDSSFGSNGPSPQPSPGQVPADFEKAQQYHAYSAPQQPHPSQRGSVTSTNGSTYHAYTTSDAHARHYSTSSQNSQNNNSYLSPEQNISNSNGSGLTAHRYSDPNGPPYPSSRPNSDILPDTRRFSQMSVQDSSQHPALPPRDPRRMSSYNSAQQSSGGANPSAKCPVCGLFEGDEAAVSHHVSKAHFS
ncbi:hypothetical protein CKM354_000477300 [Cercospora kikuchii]|uniref:DUF7053 domain-containing protein n=1 Tax=Cercospora kikuchii TaxID=84275 RepID=A0A9P3CKK9_9PEZI|nr:uncharacterized protein CKM354_000477300 [Cercospora kikuchii]GIZ41470.1 hypothetical protein CKM354_000477300 [Cercospora kikuchii]